MQVIILKNSTGTYILGNRDHYTFYYLNCMAIKLYGGGFGDKIVKLV